MKQVNQRDAQHYIATRQAFKASALSGEKFTNGSGRLNGEDLEKFYQDVNAITYAVYSYGTPIAWHTPAGWYVVAQKFSQTTSKHQNGVRRAITSELVDA